ncbi:zinc-finger homeodomain protein 1-like [Typha latifolia]|uniref:zinc-finger homeodomain protein 1-like n=1 Tax=Typha latifolia TaxID=4733 RepID=UPI003C2AF19B
MDFDDRDEPEDEEMEEMAVASSYETPAIVMGNSGRGGAVPSGGKVGGAEGRLVAVGSGNRKVSGGRYRECLKNHAVGIGGHAVDGCGEFIAAGEEGTLDALRCAACGCHRNFHRKEAEGGAIIEAAPSYPPHHHHHHQFSPYYRTPAGYLHHHHHQMAALAAGQLQRPGPLALPSTSAGGGGHSRDEGDDVSNPGMVVMGGGGFAMGVPGSGSGSGKKRFRTKFTQEQKDKMLAFAERVGWRIQKHDEAAVQQFCEENCVKRHVLKVWMHNNKHTLGKKP